jgi:acetoin utilization deacetylase AcuC-like enzyme
MLHDADYVKLMAATPHMDKVSLEEVSRKFPSSYFCSHTYEAALMAAGSAIQVIIALIKIYNTNTNGRPNRLLTVS